MNKIQLKPKFTKIKNQLIEANKDPLKSNKDAFNSFVFSNAEMIAQGLQLYEESMNNKET